MRAPLSATLPSTTRRRNLGSRAFRWDGSGAPATELDDLGTDAGGYTEVFAGSINAVGAVVGWAKKYDGSGLDLGYRAVRWDASDTAAMELANLGTDTSGYTESYAAAINDAGTVVGSAFKYDSLGGNFGYRPVRWDASAPTRPSWGTLLRTPSSLPTPGTLQSPPSRSTTPAPPSVSRTRETKWAVRVANAPSAGTPRAPPQPSWGTWAHRAPAAVK